MIVILICAFITLLGHVASLHRIFPDLYWITGLILLITTLFFYISLDWYFWCVVKKVYLDTNKAQLAGLQSGCIINRNEHERIELQPIQTRPSEVWKQSFNDFVLLMGLKKEHPIIMLIWLIIGGIHRVVRNILIFFYTKLWHNRLRSFNFGNFCLNMFWYFKMKFQTN